MLFFLLFAHPRAFSDEPPSRFSSNLQTCVSRKEFYRIGEYLGLISSRMSFFSSFFLCGLARLAMCHTLVFNLGILN